MDIFVSNMNDNEIDKHNKQHAIVIGGSIAGLLAARVLTDHFDRVIDVALTDGSVNKEFAR